MRGPFVHIPFEMMPELGGVIKGLRLDLEILITGNTLDSHKPSDIKSMREGLGYDAAFTVHGPFMDLNPGAVDSKVRQATLERFCDCIEAASALEPKALVFHSGYEKWKYDHDPKVWLEQSLSFWPNVIERAKSKNIRIAVENIFEDEPESLKMLMDKLGSEWFGICFDAGHFNIFSGKPLNEWLDSLLPHFIEMHLHDNDRTRDAHLAIGAGTFDWKTLFGAVKDRGCLYTIEARDPENVRISMEMIRKYAS